MNTGLSAMPSPSHYSITFFRQPSRKSMLAWSISTEQPSTTVATSHFSLTLAGIRRFFSPYDALSSAQSLQSSARCRNAKKKTHLARRRGGGMTACAKPYFRAVQSCLISATPQTKKKHPWRWLICLSRPKGTRFS